jgi:hypothetical protein
MSKGLQTAMSPIETIARPHRNRISVSVPREYSSYSFQVILVPLGVDTVDASPQKSRKTGSFVDALLSCPKLGDGETLDVTRDPGDFGRVLDL